MAETFLRSLEHIMPFDLPAPLAISDEFVFPLSHPLPGLKEAFDRLVAEYYYQQNLQEQMEDYQNKLSKLKSTSNKQAKDAFIKEIEVFLKYHSALPQLKHAYISKQSFLQGLDEFFTLSSNCSKDSQQIMQTVIKQIKDAASQADLYHAYIVNHLLIKGSEATDNALFYPTYTAQSSHKKINPHSNVIYYTEINRIIEKCIEGNFDITILKTFHEYFSCEADFALGQDKFLVIPEKFNTMHNQMNAYIKQINFHIKGNHLIDTDIDKEFMSVCKAINKIQDEIKQTSKTQFHAAILQQHYYSHLAKSHYITVKQMTTLLSYLKQLEGIHKKLFKQNDITPSLSSDVSISPSPNTKAETNFDNITYNPITVPSPEIVSPSTLSTPLLVEEPKEKKEVLLSQDDASADTIPVGDIPVVDTTTATSHDLIKDLTLAPSAVTLPAVIAPVVTGSLSPVQDKGIASEITTSALPDPISQILQKTPQFLPQASSSTTPTASQTTAVDYDPKGISKDIIDYVFQAKCPLQFKQLEKFVKFLGGDIKRNSTPTHFYITLNNQLRRLVTNDDEQITTSRVGGSTSHNSGKVNKYLDPWVITGFKNALISLGYTQEFFQNLAGYHLIHRKK